MRAHQARELHVHIKRIKCVHIKRAECSWTSSTRNPFDVVRIICTEFAHAHLADKACVHVKCIKRAHEHEDAHPAHDVYACTSSTQSVRLHIKRTTCARAHQVNQVCSCTSSNQSARICSARSMRAYIKRTKCALHTKRTKGARVHHLQKLRPCIASAQSVYVYVKRTKHSCTSSARSMCVYIRRTAWHIRRTACTSGVQRARARQTR